MLITASFCAVLFTLIVGALVFGNTRSLDAAAERVEHTQEVLASLQRASLLAERVQYRLRLFILTGDEDQLTRARSSATQMETNTVHLKAQVADNSAQIKNVQGMAACSAELSQVTEGFTQKSALPDITLQRCQQVISLMNDIEQSLLKERTQGSQLTSFRSMGTELGFVGISLVTLIVLFGFLLRDAVLRRSAGKANQLVTETLAQSVKALEDRAHESELLTFARDELQLCVEVGQIYKSATQSFSRLLAGSNGSLCMINNSRQMVEVVSSWGESAIDDFSPPESCCGLRSGQPRWRQPGVSEIHCNHFFEQCTGALPLPARGRARQHAGRAVCAVRR